MGSKLFKPWLHVFELDLNRFQIDSNLPSHLVTDLPLPLEGPFGQGPVAPLPETAQNASVVGPSREYPTRE